MSFLKEGMCFFGLLTLAPDFPNSFFQLWLRVQESQRKELSFK